MIIEKNEIAGKLKKLKNLLNNKSMETNGVLVEGNTLYATNLEIGIRAKLDIPTSEERFVIPRHAIDLIDALPTGEVEITSDGATVSVKCGNIKNKVKTYDVSTYPVVDRTVEAATSKITISGAEFMDALDSVMYAVADESPKKEVLKGVLLEAADGTLNIVGSDGLRVAWNKVKYDGEFKVIVPKVAIKQILSVGITGDISFEWNNSHIIFKSEEYEVQSRILTGEYLSYKALFDGYDNTCIIDRKSLTECLKRTLICTEDKTHKAVACDFSAESVSVSLNKSEAEYEEKIKLDMPLDAPIVIGFNGRYLLDAVASCISDKVTVKLKSETTPIIMEDDSFSSLLLPVRLH